MFATTTFKVRSLYLTACLVLSGCASIDTRIPEVPMEALNSEKAYQEKSAFDEMRVLQMRLQEAAVPILRANAGLCPKVRQDIGIVTHQSQSYAKRLRPAAKRELNVLDHPTIFLIIANSPAQQAGLQPGDALLGEDEQPVALTDDHIQEQLSAGSAIRIRRDDEILSVTIKPYESCDYAVRLSQSSIINAYANGRTITFTAGMLNFVESEEELALIIGHELAHNTMGHIRKSITNYILSGLNTRYTRPFESEADYVGLYYMVRAGYNPENVENVWRRLAVLNPKSVARAKTHPTYPDRYLRIAAIRKEIEDKQKSGAPLLPNFKTED